MKNLLYIGNKLSKHGSTVTSIETLGSLLEFGGYKVITASSKRNRMLRLLEMWFTIIKHRKSTSFILIDTYSTANFYFAWSCAKIARLINIPYIPILRGGNLPKRLVTQPKRCQKLFSQAKVNVAPSDYLLKAFKDFGLTNVIHIPNSIKLYEYKFKFRKKLQPKLLWVRSFSEIYNPILALKILKYLQQDYPTASLCMVGPNKDGSLKTCKDFAETHQLNVEFTGRLSKEEWITVSEGYDVFINTTNFDNTPVSVIEAMALGLPVISTNVGGLPYLIEDKKDGILVPPNNVSQFSEAILTLLEHQSLARSISIHAREKVENFDWDVIKHQWRELLV